MHAFTQTLQNSSHLIDAICYEKYAYLPRTMSILTKRFRENRTHKNSLIRRKKNKRTRNELLAKFSWTQSKKRQIENSNWHDSTIFFSQSYKMTMFNMFFSFAAAAANAAHDAFDFRIIIKCFCSCYVNSSKWWFLFVFSSLASVAIFSNRNHTNKICYCMQHAIVFVISFLATSYLNYAA